ncbi:MAG: glycosyltransferase family 4 protein [Acidobacteriota bacterium]
MRRVLVVHNYYRQHGGEDEVVANERALLEQRGHEVRLFALHNDDLIQRNRVMTAARSLWNPQTYRALRSLVAGWRADIAHFHNTFPLVSPAGYWAARKGGAAVVQTLHNYRPFCVNALFFRDGRPCELCMGRALPWPGVLHGCYRGSRLASGAAAMAIVGGRILGAAGRAVDRFIAGSAFSAQRYVTGGLPTDKIVLKTHFLASDPGPGDGRGGYALFVGRLAPEKGLATMLSAWQVIGATVPLRIAGDGPLAPLVRHAAATQKGVSWLGELQPNEVAREMGDAAFLVFPSEWYETFGRVGMEALARGTPLVVARIGAVAELVDPGRTGVHFDPGDATDLAAKVAWLIDHPRELASMREAARQDYEAKYTADKNYGRLVEIYDEAVAEASGAHGAG